VEQTPFDLANWISGPAAERVLRAWDRERHVSLPAYRELHRDVALARGRTFVLSLADLARGDAGRAATLAQKLIDEGAAGGCSPEEVVGAFRIFLRAIRAELAEAAIDAELRVAAERELGEVFLTCASALADGLSGGLVRAQRDLAAKDATIGRLEQDRSQIAALVEADLQEAVALTTAALASVEPPSNHDARVKVLKACEGLDVLRDRAERVLEVERLEKSTILRSERTQVRDLLTAVARSWKAQVGAREIEVSVESDGLEVCGDAGMIGRALDSYLENAVRFTPVHGRIRLEARRRGDKARITVWDSGPPLHPDVRARAFDKYWTSKGRSGASRGLGLYLCRLVAERHGGSAWTDDEQGCCAFHLTLPLAAEPAATAAQISS